jgi:hypothetical protein
LALNNALQKQRRTGPMQQVETREWWLWGFAVTVTLVLTVGIVSLTFPGNHFLRNSDWLDLREWVRGLACLVLMFDIYTVYQQLQLQRIRRELTERNQLFEVITENAAGYDRGRRRHWKPALQQPCVPESARIFVGGIEVDLLRRANPCNGTSRRPQMDWLDLGGELQC